MEWIMKCANVVLLCVGCLLAGRYWRELEVHAEPTERAERNGDVNGDGRTDISDPIALLGFLFLGNSEELPLSIVWTSRDSSEGGES